MNRKTILFLINGFGVEKKESYSIYDEAIMPTFDELTKKYMFSTINSDVSNYYDAYRNISMDIHELYNYSIIDADIENKKILTKDPLINLKQELDTRNTRLHLFCLVDTSMKIVDHLKEVIKYLNIEKNRKISLHLVISSSDIKDYKSLSNVLSKINMELAPFATIGFILGLSSIDNNAKQVDLNFFFRMLISKVGEKWQSFTQRFDVLYGMKTQPRDTKPFIVNSDFDLGKDDMFMFFNYDNINLSNFVDTLSAITFGSEMNNFTYTSLFPVTCNKTISHMYEPKLAERYLAKNLESIKAKALILCKQDQVNVINYYSNGFQTESNPNVTFVDITPHEDNPASIVNIVNKFDHDLIIINYDITNESKTEELKAKLTKIDNVIKALYDNINGSKYTLFISSLYGMSKTMINDRGTSCQVVFGEVPLIYVDDFITKKDYLIAPGNINDLAKSALKNINKGSKFETIIERKNALYRMIFK